MRKLSSICSLAALALFGACDRSTSATANDPLKTDLALADLAQPYQAQQNTLFTGEQVAPVSEIEQAEVETEVRDVAPVVTPKIVTAKVEIPQSPTAARARNLRVAPRQPVMIARSATPRANGAPSARRSITASDATPAREARETAPGTATSSNGVAAIDQTPVPARTTYGTSNGSVAEGNDGYANGSAEQPAGRNSRNTVRSAVIGAGAGAVLGAVVNRDNRGRGAAIGGAAGAILGAVIGNNTGSQR